MIPFINRSIKLTLTFVFIAAANLSVYAQKDLVKPFITLPALSRRIERSIASAALNTQLERHLSRQTVATIFHTSDAHGFFYPSNGRGGYAALANIIKRGPAHYLLLDSGDFSHGSGETLSSKGINAIKMMNAVHYHAVTLGNHEFDFGDENVIKMIKQARFPVLAANAALENSPDLIRPYEIFNVNGIRIAIIGLANISSPRFNPNGNNDLTESLSKTLAKIQQEQAEVVIVLAHHALPNERHLEKMDIGKIMEQFAGKIHLVLGGHAHRIVQNEKQNGIAFVESGSHLQDVSKVTIERNNYTGEIQISSELIPLILGKTGEDKKIKALAEQLRATGMDLSLGATAAAFEEYPPFKDHLDAPVNNWIADLIREYSGTQIGVQNNHSIHSKIPQGNITERDLIATYPFDDVIIQFPISGELLQEFVEKTFGQFTFSGLDIAYVQYENGTRKIMSIKVNGSPIEPDKIYTIATNSYVAKGKNGSKGKFAQIPADLKQNVGKKTVRTLMKEQLTKRSPLVPPATGRIRKIELPTKVPLP